MNKTKTILAAAFAVTMTSASAQDKTGEAPTDFVNISGGYFFDLDSPYVYGSYVFETGGNGFFGFELMTLSTEDTEQYGSSTIDFDSRVTTFGLVTQSSYALSENDFVNFSFGGGVAHYAVDGRVRGGGKGDDETTTYYLSASLGYERRINNALSFNTGVRLLHLGNDHVESDGVKVEIDPDPVYVGLEAGFTYKF